MKNPFLRLITHDTKEVIVNVNQIVCMKKCNDHPNKPGEPELLTEIKLTAGETIYVSDSVDDLFDRIEGI
jgi:hypothetical protein